MSVSRRLAPCLPLLALLVLGCDGAPITAPITGEPVCPDIEVGAAHTKMRGGLRFPVRLRVLEGQKQQLKLVLTGRRTADGTPSQTYLPDASRELTLEWAQCENEHAPRAVTNVVAKRGDADPSTYECGNAVVYKTTKLTVHRGQPASHTFAFEAPPKPSCWESEAPAAAPPPTAPEASASASAAPPAPSAPSPAPSK